MPYVGPISRKDLIAALRKAGFSGPTPRSRHEIMERGGVTVRIPNSHSAEVSTGLLRRLLNEAGLTREE
jgi:predicted RNA binding protein YcfA (HicA-like mRNA interferase family)